MISRRSHAQLLWGVSNATPLNYQFSVHRYTNSNPFFDLFFFCPTTLTSTSLPSVKNEGHIGIRTRISGLQIHRTTVVLCTQWVIRPKFVAPNSFKRPRRHASRMVFRLSGCEKFITPSVFHFQSLFLIANLVEQASTDSFNFTSKMGFGAVP